MQITLNPGTPAELRLIAAFVNDLADLAALEHPESAIPATEAPVVKKTRGGKSVSTAPVAAKPEEAAPADAGNVAAAASTATSSEATGATPAVSSVSHDDLRKVFASLSQQGKGEAGIAALGKLGHTSIKGIPADKLAEAHAVLVTL